MNIKEGDSVVWFHRASRGSTVTLTKKAGTVRQIASDVAIIRTEAGGHTRIKIDRLTLKANDTPRSIYEELNRVLAPVQIGGMTCHLT